MSDLIIEGAKGLPDGLYVIKDSELFKYKAKGGTVRSYHVMDRPKGEWKSVKASIYPYGYDVECSVCGHKMGSSFGYKYCPNCGADMRGGEDK